MNNFESWFATTKLSAIDRAGALAAWEYMQDKIKAMREAGDAMGEWIEKKCNLHENEWRVLMPWREAVKD